MYKTNFWCIFWIRFFAIFFFPKDNNTRVSGVVVYSLAPQSLTFPPRFVAIATHLVPTHTPLKTTLFILPTDRRQPTLMIHSVRVRILLYVYHVLTL